jgi:putative transposase
VNAFVDERRSDFGVELIRRTLGVSASAYYERRSAERSQRQVDDERLLTRVREVHAADYHATATGARGRRCVGGEQVGRGRVQRLMREHGIQGAKRRGKPWRTTTPDAGAGRRPDLVERDFTASGPTSCGSPT